MSADNILFEEVHILYEYCMNLMIIAVVAVVFAAELTSRLKTTCYHL